MNENPKKCVTKRFDGPILKTMKKFETENY